MEKEIGLEVSKLEQLFAQIKQGKQDVDAKIYNEYIKLVDFFAKKFNMDKEVVQDIYNEVFTYVYNNVLNNVIQPKDFTLCIENVFAKQCMKRSKTQNSVEKVSLSNRLIEKRASIATAERAKNQEIARQSLMFIAEVLEEISHDAELMQLYGLDELHINMIRDFHGINKSNKSYKLAEIAKKYDVTEARAQAVLVKGLSKLRKSDEFITIKNNYKF